MQLGPDLAVRILNEMKALTNESIIIIDHTSIIIASSKKRRIGQYHGGAAHVIKSKETLHISPHLAVQLTGVKPGINLPICFNDQVIGVIGITGIPEEVAPFAEMIRKMTELIIKEAHYIEKQAWEARMLETFFYEWIYNNEVTESFMERGEILGIAFKHHYQCILMEVNLNWSSEKLLTVYSVLEGWFDKTFKHAANNYLVRWGRNRFMLIVNDELNKSGLLLHEQLLKCHVYLRDHLKIPLWVGVSRSCEQYTLTKSYHEAKKALKVAERKKEIIYYDSLLLDLILQDTTSETQSEYVNRVFSHLKNDQELMNTLSIYLANNLSLKQSAHDLHIHINTLHYRLNLIKKLTGIDPKSTDGITLFHLALNLLDEDTVRMRE